MVNTLRHFILSPQPVWVSCPERAGVTLARYAMERLPPPRPTVAALAPTAFALVTRTFAPGPRAFVVLRRFYEGKEKVG